MNIKRGLGSYQETYAPPPPRPILLAVDISFILTKGELLTLVSKYHVVPKILQNLSKTIALVKERAEGPDSELMRKLLITSKRERSLLHLCFFHNTHNTSFGLVFPRVRQS